MTPSLRGRETIILSGARPIISLASLPTAIILLSKIEIETTDGSLIIIPLFGTKTKVLVVQHTFGIPARMEEILRIAKTHKLFVIEDCAHATGLKYKNKLLGTFGDAAFFSFGRDKMISSVFGGMAVTADKILASKIKEYQKSLEFPNTFWIFSQLIYSPLIFLIVQTYQLFYFGKVLHFLTKKLNLLSKAVANIEKKGQKPTYFPKKLPSSLASLALLQLGRLDEFHLSRLEAVNFYSKLGNLPITYPPRDIPLLRYTVLTKDRDKIKNFMKRYGVYLDTWYDSPIAPKDTDFSAIGYSLGSCPMAEKLAKESLNLPTNPNLSEKEIQYVANVLQKYYAS